MNNKITEEKFFKDFVNTADNMYRLGWDERNGGNISLMLDQTISAKYFANEKGTRLIPLGFDGIVLSGKYFMVTGTGKFFKNVKSDPQNNVGIFRVSSDGTHAELLWGYEDGGKFTSELPAHLMSHIERLKTDQQNRVIMHTHPTNLLAMTYVHPLNSEKFTHTLWQMSTECVVVFPDGIEVLPWMLCGTNEIGKATAEKMQSSRVVVWAMHGIYGAGRTLDETFGLIETVEKASQIFMLTAHLPKLNTITDAQIKELASAFKVKIKDGILK